MNNWDIYEIEGYKDILSMLDNHFNSLISAAKVQIDNGEDPIFAGQHVKDKMEEFMNSIKGYGASDTEPREALITFICNELNLPFDQNTLDKFNGVRFIDNLKIEPSI